jgi:tripartite-type tricarboxylate transporter receptor subunit TctC
MIHLLAQRFVRRFCRILVFGLLLFAGVAQAEPNTVKILVGFPPGGGTDTIARILADKLKDPLGSPVIVENRPGAGGQVAAKTLKDAPADGRTFLLSHDHTVSILPLVVKNPGFDPLHDFVPVAGFATFVNALAVSGGTPAKTMNDYVAWVRRHGAGVEKVGVPSPASVPEFLVKLIDQKYALNLQAIAYQGAAPMMADMLSNQIPAGVGSVPEFIENHRVGRIRIIAVLGGVRQATLPDVPTFAELGLAGFEDVPYYGIFAPAGTPKENIDRLSGALGKVLAMPDVHARLTSMGFTVGHMTSQELTIRERTYTQTWARIIKASGFQAQ